MDEGISGHQAINPQPRLTDIDAAGWAARTRPLWRWYRLIQINAHAELPLSCRHIMRILLLMLIGLLVLAGCAREADMVPLNDAANVAGIP